MSQEDDDHSARSDRTPARSEDEFNNDGPSDRDLEASSDVEDAIYGVVDQDATAGGENVADSFRIDNTRGEHRLPVNAFLRRTTASDLSPTQAIDMLQHKYTLDFGC